MVTEGVGLVLEGGGMRCVFTAGVLDYFMDHNIEFPYVTGVSAGACAALCYLSRQPRRQKQCLIDLQSKYHYLRLRNFFTKHNVFDLDMVVGEFSNTVLPFDYETYFKNPARCEIATSNSLTGKADYFDERQSRERLVQIAKSTCAVPVVTNKQYVDGVQMYDGGVCDPVPIHRAISQGYKKNVVVLTRNAFRRSPFTNIPIPSGVFPKAITPKMRHRGRDYNQLMAFIEKKSKTGEILVIQPQKKLKVSSIERNPDRLQELYDEGYECAKVIHAYLGI